MPSALGALLFASAAGPAGEGAEPSLSATALKASFPILAFLFLAPFFWLFFRRTWRELDVEAHEHRHRTLAAGRYDFRPVVLFATTAIVLTLQEYYGGRDFYDDHIKPFLRELELAALVTPTSLGRFVHLRRYSELYSYGWWSFSRVFGYVAIPMIVWKLVFRRDSLRDMGLRARGLLGHAWVYLGSLALVVPR